MAAPLDRLRAIWWRSAPRVPSGSLGAFYLIERGESAAAALYMIGSVVLSVAALIGTMHLVRAVS